MGHDRNNNEYNGIPIVNDNIPKFQQIFLEGCCQLWEADLVREEMERKRDSITAKEIGQYERKIERIKKPISQTLQDTYKLIWGLRRGLYERYRKSPEYRHAIDEACAKDPILWINSFAWTFDPRLVLVGIPAKLPLVLFPQQEMAITEVMRAMEDRRSLLVEKSRAEGATEIFTAFCVHHWIYKDGFKAGWGSRIEKLVDERGNNDTIFGRLRRFISYLPKEMLPAQYERKPRNPWDNKCRIVNPANGNTIIGEGGDNIGRGGRSTVYFVDEKAFVEHPRAVDEALSYNTDCQVDLSTPNGMNEFYEKRSSGKVRVIQLGWWKNPSKNDSWASGERNEHSSWYQFQKMTRDSVLLAKEVDIDYNASVAGLMIPTEWVRSAVDFDLVIPEGSEKVAGFDPSAGGKDDGAYVLREGPVVKDIYITQETTPLQQTWDVANRAEEDGVKAMIYDINTVGEDVYPALKAGDRTVSIRLQGEYGQSKASERIIESEGRRGYEKFRNRRGELWWMVRRRFEKTFLHRNDIEYFPTDQLISIPNDIGLINELSSPLMVTSATGKIGVESKIEMKNRNVRSPNKADALIYSFADSEAVQTVGGGFEYENAEVFGDFAVSLHIAHNLYVSVKVTPELMLYAVVAMFELTTQRLVVVKDVEIPEVDIEELKTQVLNIGQPEMVVVHEWVGNDEIFKGLETGHKSIWYQFRKAGISIKQNYSDDTLGAFAISNQLLRDKRLKIHSNAERTMQQIRNWKMERGRPKPGLWFAEALMAIMTRMKKTQRATFQPTVEAMKAPAGRYRKMYLT